MKKTRNTVILIAAVAFVVCLPFMADAKPDGRMGTDCASCHTNGIPGQKPPPDPPPPPPPPPPTDPPPPPVDPTPTDTPPTDPSPTDPPPMDPPITDSPADPPTEPEPPKPAVEHVLGVEISTIWDYNSLNSKDDLDYFFIAVVETDTSVNLVELITPSGKVLQITSEPLTEVENVRTEFYQDGDVLVWRYEVSLTEKKELETYGTGKYRINAYLEEGLESAKVKYDSVKGKKPKKEKPPKERGDDDEQYDDDD